MPAQVASSVENNFTKGLVTEFTGLNFPENAATDTDNCTYTIVGDVTRRLGINYETNFTVNSSLNRTGKAISTYKWNNAGGDGATQIVVSQVGTTLNFYQSSSATNTNPISNQLLSSTVDITPFATGLTPDPATQECQYADGNGYLFVYHPSCQPFFCSISAGVITATIINVNIRDFTGVIDGYGVSDRPNTLTNPHLYNLINQGWTQGSPWQATSTTGASPSVVPSGSLGFSVQAGITGTTIGDTVTVKTTSNVFIPGVGTIAAGTDVMAGILTSYVGTSMVLTITGDLLKVRGYPVGPYLIVPYNKGYINTWSAALSNFPSNADVWWFFKNTSNVFDPVTTLNQVTLNSGNAPRGHFILDAFNQNKSLTSTVSGITSITTSIRPRTGTWFQGRVWYTGVDSSQVKQGTSDFYTWTENIYFSQIATGPGQFGMCHQLNDPTSETLFDLLPTDGGVITIQGAGSIYKLFPIQNGMLVFAANGIWFITGSQGIGFTANDYTITKISSVQSISSTSFVDVQGLPYFWNEEGIYAVQPSKNGGLEVNPITVGSILAFYNAIPVSSKKYVRGAYHPIDYNIQWIYKSISDGNDVTARYDYDRILNFNTYNKAFFPYTVAGVTTSANPHINSILYVSSPGGIDNPDPAFKYFTSRSVTDFTFSDEHDTRYVDWFSFNSVGFNYSSFFVTGYKLHGQGQRRFQLPYIYIFSRAETGTAYKIQGLWDYANAGNSGKWSSIQRIFNNKPYFGMIFRRHRIRGQGIVLQIKVLSVDGYPFDIMGWSTYEIINQGV